MNEAEIRGDVDRFAGLGGNALAERADQRRRADGGRSDRGIGRLDLLLLVDPPPDFVERGKAEKGTPVYRALWGMSEWNADGKLHDWDVRDRLHEIRVPTLVTSGRYDECTPEPAEAEACRPYLERQFALLRPKLIVALGKSAASLLLSTDATSASSFSSMRVRSSGACV